jgi:hypothetical protein
VVACQEQVPTALDDGPLPEEPLTIEVELPWSEFGSNLQVLGGFSSAASIPTPVVAHGYGGTLEARTLMRFDSLPPAIRVTQSSDGAVVTDTEPKYIAGFLTLVFDTAATVAPGPTELELGTLQQEWQPRSASWTMAVDTIGGQQAWVEPGGGPVLHTVTETWDPSDADSVTIALDSAFLYDWVTPDYPTRGGRLLSTTDGVHLVLKGARFRLNMRSSVADTIVEDTVDMSGRTVIYDPPPPAPTTLRVGGAPAWRTLLSMSPPALTGPPELCAAVGCPYTPEAGEISYAALALTTQASEPGFQPTDTLDIDVRPVLDTVTLPKSPLGASQTGGFGKAIEPGAFGSAAGALVDIPVTGFVRTLLAGPDEEGNEPPSVLALISAIEPSTLSFASFDGPGSAGEPVLRMIITLGEAQVLP